MDEQYIFGGLVGMFFSNASNTECHEFVKMFNNLISVFSAEQQGAVANLSLYLLHL